MRSAPFFHFFIKNDEIIEKINTQDRKSMQQPMTFSFLHDRNWMKIQRQQSTLPDLKIYTKFNIEETFSVRAQILHPSYSRLRFENTGDHIDNILNTIRNVKNTREKIKCNEKIKMFFTSLGRGPYREQLCSLSWVPVFLLSLDFSTWSKWKNWVNILKAVFSRQVMQAQIRLQTIVFHP